MVGDLRIKVLGTRFNVSAYPADNVIETVLAEGKVSLGQNNAGFFDKATDLVPDQMASFDKTTKMTYVKTVETDNYTLWTAGILKFESTDLNRILKQVERFYNIRFHFSDPLLGGLRISGKLELNEDKDEICRRIATTASIKILKKGDDLYEVIR
jgi:ferric-dicitrate binding protein FerR (iron transport regulator)